MTIVGSFSESCTNCSADTNKEECHESDAVDLVCKEEHDSHYCHANAGLEIVSTKISHALTSRDSPTDMLHPVLPLEWLQQASAGQGNPPYEPGTDREKALRDWLEPVADLIDLTLEESRRKGAPRHRRGQRLTLPNSPPCSTISTGSGSRRWRRCGRCLGTPMSRPCAEACRRVQSAILRTSPRPPRGVRSRTAPPSATGGHVGGAHRRARRHVGGRDAGAEHRAPPCSRQPRSHVERAAAQLTPAQFLPVVPLQVSRIRALPSRHVSGRASVASMPVGHGRAGATGVQPMHRLPAEVDVLAAPNNGGRPSSKTRV